MGNQSSAIRELQNEVEASTARQREQAERVEQLQQDLKKMQNGLPEDTLRGLQQQIDQSHTNIEANVQQAVGHSQAIIREEVKSAAIKQDDRLSSIERHIYELDNKLKLAKEERKKAEADMRRSIAEGDKKLEVFKIKMQNQQDKHVNAMEKKLKQMDMQFKQQQELLDMQMMHTKECADKKLQLANRLGEMKARMTPEEYNQTLKVMTLEASPVPIYTDDPPICREELDREQNYDNETGWFDHFGVDSPKPTARNWTQTHTAPVKQLY